MSVDTGSTIADILKPEGVIPFLHATTKDEVLEELAEHAARIAGVNKDAILKVLREREQLGTTGVGDGIAIPHGRLRDLDRLYGLFARLDQPVPFESIDDRPVDLIFLLVGPLDSGIDHLKALARISHLLSESGMRAQLRHSENAEDLHSLLTRPPAARVA